MSALLDTHALIWWKAGGRRLSRRAHAAIAGGDLRISPVVFWEVATLLRKGRIALDRDLFDWVADVLGGEDIALAPLSAEAAAEAGQLPARGFLGDPADCMLYSTAKELQVPLVSKDARIHAFGKTDAAVRVIW